MVCDQLATINVVRPLAWPQHGCMYEYLYFLQSAGAVGASSPPQWARALGSINAVTSCSVPPVCGPRSRTTLTGVQHVLMICSRSVSVWAGARGGTRRSAACKVWSRLSVPQLANSPCCSLPTLLPTKPPHVSSRLRTAAYSS